MTHQNLTATRCDGADATVVRASRRSSFDCWELVLHVPVIVAHFFALAWAWTLSHQSQEVQEAICEYVLGVFFILMESQ